MDVSIYMKGHYDDFGGFGRGKNKANMPAFGRKSEARIPKSEIRQKDTE